MPRHISICDKIRLLLKYFENEPAASRSGVPRYKSTQRWLEPRPDSRLVASYWAERSLEKSTKDNKNDECRSVFDSEIEGRNGKKPTDGQYDSSLPTNMGRLNTGGRWREDAQTGGGSTVSFVRRLHRKSIAGRAHRALAPRHVSDHLSTHHHPYRSTLHPHHHELPKVFLWIPQEGERQTVVNWRENRRNTSQYRRRRPLSSGLIYAIRTRHRCRGRVQRGPRARRRER